MYVECSGTDEKYQAIANIYTIPVGSSMFFCQTKYTANLLATQLRADGHQVALLTGMNISLCFLSCKKFKSYCRKI